MRKISSFINAFVSPSEHDIPRSRLNRVGQALHRRLADSIEESFQHACLLGDFDTAADLVDVLERQRDRWIKKNGAERRGDQPQLMRMKDELARRQHLQASESPTGQPMNGVSTHTTNLSGER